jgi:hypothetical protein
MTPREPAAPDQGSASALDIELSPQSLWSLPACVHLLSTSTLSLSCLLINGPTILLSHHQSFSITASTEYFL